MHTAAKNILCSPQPRILLGTQKSKKLYQAIHADTLIKKIQLTVARMHRISTDGRFELESHMLRVQMQSRIQP